MLEAMMKYGIILYVLGVMLVAGIAAKIVSYVTTNNLVKAAGDMQKSNQKLMRLVKAKFEHASMVSDKVQNVEAFVEKYLYEYKICGINLSAWKSFPLKMVWLIIAVGAVGVVLSFRMAGVGEQTFQYAAITAAFAVFLISLHILGDEKIKMDATKNYMVEHLENVCVHRYEKANRGVRANVENIVEESTESESETKEIVNTEVEAELKEQLNAETHMQEETQVEEKLQIAEEELVSKERDEQEMRIRAILQEFLA